MKNRSGTYHLFSMLLAILVAVSISLPSDLLAAHCDMDTQQLPLSEMTAEHCPNMEAPSSHVGHDHQNGDDCNWTLSCACDINSTKIAEAVPTISKTAKAFVVSVIQYLDAERASTPTFIVDVEFSLNNHFPPIFLLNSVFLN